MKTIALLDLTSGGHKDAFMCLFSKACLQLDTKVICLYPDIAQIKNWIDIHMPQYASNIIYVEYNAVYKEFKRFGRFNNILSVLRYWKNCAQVLKAVEERYELKINLVYFNWIDSQMTNNIPAKVLDFIFPYKWSGLYFHPIMFRTSAELLERKATFRDIDSIFLSKNCIAVTIHDEGILERYQKRINKKVLLFPEIADATPANMEIPLAKLIREKAKGRIVIGTIGLEYHKGCTALIRLCNIADPDKFFFAFTGLFNQQQLVHFPPEEQKEVIDFMNNLPSHAVWQTGVLQEGEEYNSVFCSFDIIHIIYKNFYSSSNRLTKAAIFHRLVLASDNGCIGDDVPKYQLGEVADDNETAEQYKKIEALRDKIIAHNLPLEQWKIYSEKHSTDRLKDKFQELLNLVDDEK